MDREPLRQLLRSLQHLTEPGGDGLSDAELLSRFVRQRDQAAFELLVWRHGPMVLSACRRLLANPHDAEDAFQAVWLILVRKAGSISQGQALVGWLHRVACRVARRLRADLARRAGRERPGAEEVACAAQMSADGNDFLQALDEEVNRLPNRQRSAFVLCCLEGKSGEEAARQLGCPPGTVSSRLTRARTVLRRRLTRRGLAPAAGGVAALLAGDTLAAPLPGPVVSATVNTSLLFSTGGTAAALSSRAVTLAEGVLRAMFLTKAKTAALVLLLVSVLTAGGLLAQQSQGENPPAPAATRVDRPQADSKPPKEERKGPLVVQVVRPQRLDVERTTQQPCTVHAFQKADLVPQVAGVVKELTVDIGDWVKKGQVLAQIEAPLVSLEQKQARAAMMQARGKVGEAQAAVTGAKAEVAVAKIVILQREDEVNAAEATLKYRTAQYKRFMDLLKNNAIEQHLVDEQESQLNAARSHAAAAKRALEAARADLEVKQSKVVQAEAALATAEANVEESRTAVDKAQVMVDFATIRAPFDGVVTRRNVFQGDFVLPANQGGKLGLLTIERVDLLRVVVEIPDRDAPLAKPGLPVELALDSLPGRLLHAKVSRVAFAENPNTRTMRTEIDLPNAKELLRPGMFGTARIRLGKASGGGLWIPRSAIVSTMARGPEVTVSFFVVRDGKAHRVVAKEAGESDAGIEVLKGLRAADEVIVNPERLARLARQGQDIPVAVQRTPGKQ